MGQPLPREAYRLVTQNVTAQACATGGSAHASGRSSSHIDTSHLDSSKLFATEPQLVCVDFQAIADSSTGGAYSGLPRPYGRFMAVRNGDGLGLYERQPPPRIAHWHAKLAGLPPGDGAGRAGPLSPERSANLSTMPSQTSASDGPVTSPTRSVRGGAARSSAPLGPLAPPSSLDAVKFARPETAAATAGGGSTQNVDVLPGGHHSGWFKMPAATFLNRVPVLPGGHLRIETGNTTAREFLMSGLHHPPPGRAGLSTTGGGAGAWPGAGGVGGLGNIPQPPLGSSGTFGAGAVSAQVSNGGGEQPASPPQPASSSAQAGSTGSSRAASPPGYRQLHGVFVPVDARVDSAVRTSLGISPDGDAPAVPAATALLEAMSAAQRPLPTDTHGAFEFATAHRRAAVAQLPLERGLPRRHVPALGK